MSTPALPQFWSNPQSIIQYTRAASENPLNVIPPSTLTRPFTTFPSWLGATHYIVDPRILRVIFRDHVADYPKSRVVDVKLAPLIPESVFVTHGEKWRSQHKHMTGVFSWRNIQSFEPLIRMVASNFMDQTPLRSDVDVSPIMLDVTFQVICKALVGRHDGELMDELQHIFAQRQSELVRAFPSDIPAIKWGQYFNFRHIYYARSIRRFKRASEVIIADRLDGGIPKEPDFLEILLDAHNYRAAPSKASLKAIRDNLATFLIAGHETTAKTLSWALYAIGFFREAQAKIRAEAEGADASDGLVMTEAFLNETLRLYPVAPMLLRRASKDEAFGDLRLKRGEGIIIPMLTLHRHRDYWERPDEFDPERFVGFKPAPYTFLPFGAGPRVCIGASLAIMEAKIIFAEIIKRYHIEPSDYVPQAVMKLTLGSRNGIRARFSQMSSKPSSVHSSPEPSSIHFSAAH